MRTSDEREARAVFARVAFTGSSVTSLEFRDRVARRTRRAKAPISLGMLEPLEAYFRLLAQWNATINLTALPLDAPTDETFDRLLVEPLVAARQIPSHTPSVWVDLGSGGGSPAIPLKIARPALRLTMIESKERKSAFLREVIRALGLVDATVATATLAQLGEHHRSALTLRYLDVLPVPEVAVVLGRTVHATEALLVRARNAFRSAYGERNDDEH